jgi:hypothetical protein
LRWKVENLNVPVKALPSLQAAVQPTDRRFTFLPDTVKETFFASEVLPEYEPLGAAAVAGTARTSEAAAAATYEKFRQAGSAERLCIGAT